MAPNSAPRRRLVRLMDLRRAELRTTWAEVADAGGLSVATLRRIRNTDAPLTADNEVGIEDGLRWQRGSVARVGQGLDPIPLDTAEPDPERDRLRAAYDEYRQTHTAQEALAWLRAEVERVAADRLDRVTRTGDVGRTG